MRRAKTLSFTLAAFLLAAVGHATGGSLTPAPADLGSGVQRDAFGRVVLTSQGERIQYGEPGGDSSAEAVPPRPVSAVAVPPSDDLFVRTWRWSVLGDSIGATALRVADLDADGEREIAVTSYPDYWAILRWTGAGYEQEWSSPRSGAALGGLAVAQADGDAALEIVVAAAEIVRVYDGASRAVQAIWGAPSGAPKAVAAGDVDADGTAEVVLIDADNLWVLDLTTGTVEGVRYGFGGVALSLCRIDADAPLEIVVANGDQPGSVLDGATLAVQWGRAAGFGTRLACGDLDADGVDEIASAWTWSGGVRAYDPKDDLELFHVPGSYGIGAVAIGNVDADAAAEVLYGDSQWGAIHVLAGTSGLEEWSVSNPEHGVTQIAVGDGDGDGVAEVFWGAGATSSGPDILFVADGSSHLREWESRDLRGPFFALADADLAGDGERSLVTGSQSSNSGYGGGVLLAFDLGVQRQVAWNPLPTSNSSRGLARARAANLDDDPQEEVCFDSGGSYYPRVSCFDGLTGVLQWEVSLPYGLGVASLEIADVDKDGASEVVIGVRIESTAASEVYVYCHFGATGWLKWRSPELGTAQLALLRVGETDGDSVPEIVVGGLANAVTVVDGANGAIQQGPLALPVTALDLVDLPGGPGEELFVGLTDGTIRELNPVSGETRVVLSGLGAAVDALGFGQLDESPARELVVAVRGTVTIYDWVLGSPIWSDATLGIGAGQSDSLLLADFDGDGRDDLVINTGFGFASFLTAASAELPFADGFEAAGLRRWTRTYPAMP